jgi:hypothetical protein
MTNESFVPSFLTQLRLRGAIGTSGLAPGAFDKFQTFTPFVALDDQSAVRAATSGNDDLSPEKTTEFEGGFEMGLLNDRLGIEFTAFKAVTKDALVSIATAPSASFGSSPRGNIGELQNKGWEASLRLTPIESRSLRWSTDVRLDGNTNEITDLGRDPVSDTVILQLGGLDLGYPVLDAWTRVPTGYDATTNTHTRSDTSHYIGPTLPTFNVSFGNELTFGSFRLYGLVTHESGAFFSNSDRPYRVRFRTGDEYLSLLDYSGCPASGCDDETTMRTFQSDSLFDYMNLFSTYDKRDNWRLRELTMTYTLPDGFTSRLGIGRTVMTLAAKNVHWWDDCNCMDPNMNYSGGSSFGVTSGFLAQPQARQFLLSVRTTF